ncbi:hypothetical protein [Variovorax ginsengisoli]|uniref:Uncharacterized protein n=1 Tax=Variovorax ginsengisoli TaxID=363844 RepID=A0ABT8SE95_9BURK|nr:hypothetical protein [Variovorax ginsengisoli]MDN8618054.1 hypothetical protein [Variovorax ginsengisoli]MDO1537224.1 hypothetical protein [Variovorax ginsengisoli]
MAAYEDSKSCVGDRIWHVSKKEKPSGVWAVLPARVFSLGLIPGLAFLLLVSSLVSTALAAFDGWFGRLLPGWEVLMQGLNILISFSILMLMFAMNFQTDVFLSHHKCLSRLMLLGETGSVCRKMRLPRNTSWLPARGRRPWAVFAAIGNTAADALRTLADIEQECPC